MEHSGEREEIAYPQGALARLSESGGRRRPDSESRATEEGARLTGRLFRRMEPGHQGPVIPWDNRTTGVLSMSVPSPGTSASLLESAREHGPGAWDRLVALYTPLLHAWLTAAGLQSADRDDLTQRVLEILVRQLPDFEPSGRAGAFRA